jgi:hypothetical protein
MHCSKHFTHRLSVSILDDSAAIAAAVRAKHVAAVPGRGMREIALDFGIVE